MLTDNYLNGIKEWFDKYNSHLWEIHKEIEEEREYLLEIDKSIEPRLLEYANLNYVIACVEEPIRKILRFIKENRRCQDLESIAYNKYPFDIEEVVLFLKAIPVEYRRMVLEGIDCPVQYHSDLREGILQPDLDRLMIVARNVDLKNDFSQMGFFYAFAQEYGMDSEDRICLMEDIMAVRYINNGYTYTEIRKFFLLEKKRETGMSIWPWIEKFCESYQSMLYCFTSYEKALINRILKDEHFKAIGKAMGIDIESIMNGKDQDSSLGENPKELQDATSPITEIKEKKSAEETERRNKAYLSIVELLNSITDDEADFFNNGFTLEQLIDFFKTILTDKYVLNEITNTNNRMKYVYKGIALEKFCNIIGYLIDKEVMNESQVKVAKALFGKEETKTTIINYRECKTNREAFDRKENLFTTCCSYISNGRTRSSKSFIGEKTKNWFDEILDSVRQPQ